LKVGKLFAPKVLTMILLVSAGCEEEAASINIAPATMADAAVAKPDAAAARPADAGLANAVDSGLPALPVRPYAVGAGIGVSDLDVSATFYSEVLGLTFVEDVTTSDGREKIFKDVRGNTVTLADFEDERRTTQNPTKLVFAVKNVKAAYDAVLAGGGSSASAPAIFAGTTVALGYDPDKYLVELIEAPTVPSNVLVGVGIGVSSLDESADYYTRVLDLQFKRDIPVPGFMDEKELGSHEMKGLAVVLMHYLDQTKNYRDVPAKIIFNVGNAQRYAKTIADEDPSKILVPPAADPKTKVVKGAATDLEGYVVEFQQPAPSAATTKNP
jgi:predicted enzyme related to lactoylglutathione lyase